MEKYYLLKTCDEWRTYASMEELYFGDEEHVGDYLFTSCMEYFERDDDLDELPSNETEAFNLVFTQRVYGLHIETYKINSEC